MNAHPPQILILDDDKGYSDAVSEVLRGEGGYRVTQCASLEDAQERLLSEDVAMVVVDHSLVRPLPDPWEALADLQDMARPAAVGVSSGWALPEASVLAHGLSFLLSKPFDIERLLDVAASFAEASEPSEEIRGLVTAYFAALQASDWPRLGALCTEDVRYQLPGDDPRYSTTVEGREGFEAFSAKTFSGFPDVQFQVQAAHCLPSGAVVARYEGSWRTSSGERAQLPGSVIFRLADASSQSPRIREVGVRLQVRELLARHQPAASS